MHDSATAQRQRRQPSSRPSLADTSAQLSPALLSVLGCKAPTPSTPLVPTSDFSGVVTASKSAAYSVGTEIYGQRFSADGNGFLAEHVTIPASAPFVAKPKDLAWTDAAAVPLVYTTVYDALVEWGRLPFDLPRKTGEGLSVLVLGGSSGTGHVAVQLAKKMGCNVVATCSGKNREMVKELGADEVSPPQHRVHYNTLPGSLHLSPGLSPRTD